MIVQVLHRPTFVAECRELFDYVAKGTDRIDPAWLACAFASDCACDRYLKAHRLLRRSRLVNFGDRPPSSESSGTLQPGRSRQTARHLDARMPPRTQRLGLGGPTSSSSRASDPHYDLVQPSLGDRGGVHTLHRCCFRRSIARTGRLSSTPISRSRRDFVSFSVCTSSARTRPKCLDSIQLGLRRLARYVASWRSASSTLCVSLSFPFVLIDRTAQVLSFDLMWCSAAGISQISVNSCARARLLREYFR